MKTVAQIVVPLILVLGGHLITVPDAEAQLLRWRRHVARPTQTFVRRTAPRARVYAAPTPRFPYSPPAANRVNAAQWSFRTQGARSQQQLRQWGDRANATLRSYQSQSDRSQQQIRQWGSRANATLRSFQNQSNWSQQQLRQWGNQADITLRSFQTPSFSTPSFSPPPTTTPQF